MSAGLFNFCNLYIIELSSNIIILEYIMTKVLYHFFNQFESEGSPNSKINCLIEKFKDYSMESDPETGQKTQIYIINRPLVDDQYKNDYEYEDAIVLLSPKHKITFINFNNSHNNDFENYYEDFIEDLSSISDRFQYKNQVGRPREWRKEVIETVNFSAISDIPTFFSDIKIRDPIQQRRVELLISLLTGSINDIDKVGGLDIANDLLDKVKRKILLFDGNQTNFLYQDKPKKRITIQGLSGTGKTELLLHKLKDLYTKSESTKILFTCHNRVLADSLRKRIPHFFNFMRVQQQLEWEERFWCVRAWGSQNNPHSGAYRYICHYYGIPFYTFGQMRNFDYLCQQALQEIEANDGNKNKYAFDYILIDESQDFPDSFFELCERVTKEKIYVAGDIFQNIFGEQQEIKADYLLNQCYRTDPRTLMFSHALSMGLFEDQKLQWLTEEQWEQCGYRIIKDHSRYPKIELTREPIRRFEDLNSDLPPIDFIDTRNMERSEYLQKIVSIISKIREENITVRPEDIAVIYMVKDKNYISEMTYALFVKLQECGINWPINNAFESKVRVENHLFITNYNNVKGLEFPFIICVSPSPLTKNIFIRNALYMALTRSFIKTFFLIPTESEKQYNQIKMGLDTIIQNDAIEVIPPSEKEILEIQDQISFDFNQLDKSHKDMVIDLVLENYPKCTDENQEWFYNMVYNTIGEEYDPEKIRQAIDSLKDAYKLKDENN